MKTFIGLYRGPTVAEAKLIAVTADPEIISHVSGQLLSRKIPPDDPILAKLDRGRRGALRAIQQEAENEEKLPEILQIIKDESAIKATRGGEDEC